MTELSTIIREYVPGTIITEPGAYANVPMDWYHGQPCDGPSISSSGLRTIFNQSLAHYWDSSPLNPNRQEIDQTEAIVLGRAAHHLLLGEGDFDKHFVVRPDTYVSEKGEKKPWSNNANVCKEWNAAQAEAGLTILTPNQIEYIKGMSRTLSEEPAVQGGILNGLVELSMFWKDEETGIWIKSRPDAVPNDADAADLKCVADISDDGIKRGLGDRGYHQQAATVKEAMRMIFHREMENFFLVYVEQKRPHCVRIDTIDPEDVELGIEENHAALRLFKRALETRYWPGPKNISGDGGFVRRAPWARESSRRRIEQINQELAA